MTGKTWSPLLFIAGLLSFFMTFFSVSCDGKPVASFTGVELVTGTTVRQPSPFGGDAKKEQIKGEPLALAAALLAAGAALMSAGSATPRLRIGAGLGAAAAVLLFILRNKIERDLAHQELGAMLSLKPEIGFWISTAAFVAGTAAVGVSLVRTANGKTTDASPRKETFDVGAH